MVQLIARSLHQVPLVSLEHSNASKTTYKYDERRKVYQTVFGQNV
jgi:hypothetical protein